MSVDAATVRRIAHLARIAVAVSGGAVLGFETLLLGGDTLDRLGDGVFGNRHDQLFQQKLVVVLRG